MIIFIKVNSLFMHKLEGIYLTHLIPIIIIQKVHQSYTHFTLNSPRNLKFLKLLKLSEINRVISQLIQLKYQKNVNPIISPVLSKIINISLLTGHFPCLIKTARVVPIHKGGNLNEFSIYRPISVLPVVSKVIESAVFNRLAHHLEKFNLLS